MSIYLDSYRFVRLIYKSLWNILRMIYSFYVAFWGNDLLFLAVSIYFQVPGWAKSSGIFEIKLELPGHEYARFSRQQFPKGKQIKQAAASQGSGYVR